MKREIRCRFCPNGYSYVSCSKCEFGLHLRKKNVFLISIIEEIILNESFFKYCIPYYSNFCSRHILEKGQILVFSLLFLTKKYWLRTCFLYCLPYYSRCYSIADYKDKYCLLFFFFFFFASVFEEKILTENLLYYIVFLVIQVFVLYIYKRATIQTKLFSPNYVLAYS